MPALKLFKEGSFVKNYAGPASQSAFANFVRKEMNPGPKRIITRTEFDVFTDNDDTQVVGFFGLIPSSLREAYRLSVDRLGSAVSFGLVDDQDLMKQFRKFEDRIVLFRPQFLASGHEDQVLVYDGPGERGNVSSWVMRNYHGLLGLRYHHNQHQFTAPCVHIYYNHDFTLNPKTSHYWRNRIMAEIKQFSGRVMFSLSRVDDYHQELEHFRLIDEDQIIDPDTPFAAAAWDKHGQKYVLREFKLSVLRDWVQSLVDGELTPYLKSQDAPEEMFEDGVKVVVADTWQEEVIKHDRDVLIVFHAPWCNHCKMLMPILKKLAATLKVLEILNIFIKPFFRVKRWM